MSNLRSKLTYSNVVATLALVLALGGGTVYAAIKLGKNDVKSKNIAKGAVKTSDLAKNSVKSPKIKDGTIKLGDIAAGVIPQLDADVTGSATGGPQGAINADTETPLPLTGDTTFTPGEGTVSALAAEARFTIATANVANQCSPDVRLFLNGEPTRVFASPDTGENSTTLVSTLGRDADGPFGLIDPGTPLTVTAELGGDPDCTATSQLDRVEVKILQIR
jgi:hypothetical protein